MKLEKRCRNNNDVRDFLDEIEAEYKLDTPLYQSERRKIIKALDGHIAIENMEWTRGRVDTIDIEAFMLPSRAELLEKFIKRELPKFCRFRRVRYIGVEWPYVSILFDSHDYSTVALNIYFPNMDVEAE